MFQFIDIISQEIPNNFLCQFQSFFSIMIKIHVSVTPKSRLQPADRHEKRNSVLHGNFRISVHPFITRIDHGRAVSSGLFYFPHDVICCGRRPRYDFRHNLDSGPDRSLQRQWLLSVRRISHNYHFLLLEKSTFAVH